MNRYRVSLNGQDAGTWQAKNVDQAWRLAEATWLAQGKDAVHSIVVTSV